MPRGDRTGKSGMGPMTGRAMGFCAGYSAPGYANNGSGRMGGCGRGPGLGRGYGNGMHRGVGMRYRGYMGAALPVQSEEMELNALDQEKNLLERELEAIKARLETFKKEN